MAGRYRREVDSAITISRAKHGSISDLFAQYKEHPAFTGAITEATRTYYGGILSRAEQHLLRCKRFAGLKLGDVPVRHIDVAAAKQISYDYYDLGLGVGRGDAANRLRDTLRTVFNVMLGEFPGIPFNNPWDKVRKFKHTPIETRAAELLHVARFDYGSQQKCMPNWVQAHSRCTNCRSVPAHS
jgi:hypothetical protein